MTTAKPQFDREKILKEEKTLLDCYSGESRGFLATLFRFYKGNYGNLLMSAFMFFIKASPTWIIPLITAGVINIATEKPDDAVKRFIIYGAVTVVILLQII